MARTPQPPQLDWADQATPRATAYDDVYYSRAGGLAEAEAVFLAGCGLPARWAGRDRFAICELGFGTGLNALAVWRAWKHARPAHAILHMSSIEAFPLARTEAERALGAFAELGPLADQLLARWPTRAYAPQRLWFEHDGFVLTLIIDDAARALAAMTGRFDAWFLDGFAPARNPAMWDAALLARIAALSAPDARLATYSVAGSVRRALHQAGFAAEKKPGFGAKRERLEARLERKPPQSHSVFPYAASAPRRVAVIGAGIAGAACAAALLRRGAHVEVFDAAPAPAAGASGNPAALLMPRLDRAGALAELHLAAYLAALDAYPRLGPGVFTPCPVRERAEPRRQAAFADLLADPPLPPEHFAAEQGAALHRQAGLVRPRVAIEAWLRGAQLSLGAPVRIEPTDAGWRVRAETQRAFDAVVLACGPALAGFAETSFLPLRITRGQLEWGALAGAAPAQALAQGAYCAPFESGVLFGATFDRAEAADAVRADDAARARNLAALETLAPDIAARLDRASLQSRAALRAAGADFAPIAGLVPDAPAWRARYAGLAAGRAPDLSDAPPALAGLYVLGGLGARGLTLAPLLAERIASELFGEPQILSRRALEAIHPARFLLRQLKRGSR